MNLPSYKICLLNPIETLRESPRTRRFERALNNSADFSLCTIGLGDGIADGTPHLDLLDGNQMNILQRSIRHVRVLLFILTSLLRCHLLSKLLHSPNRQMRCNLLIRADIRRFLAIHNPDVVIARDIYSVPLIRGLIPRARVWIDLPDLTKEVNSMKWSYRILLEPYFNFLTRRLVLAADSFSTVSTSLASIFESAYGLQPLVVRNVAPFSKAPPSRRSGSTTTNSVRLVYVGAANRGKRIEICIETMRHLSNNYTLDLFLTPTDQSYLEELRDRARLDSRVRLMPPVEMSKLIRTIADYDLALVIMPLTSVNSANSLPNKLFQAVQARLPIITGPTPEIANIVSTFRIGEVAHSFDPSDLASAVLRLTPERVDAQRENLESAALALSEDSELAAIRQRLIVILEKV